MVTKGIVRAHYEEFHAHTFDTLDKMDDFLDRHNNENSVKEKCII